MRSGKFKSARKIVTGRSNTFFRILNTAEFVSDAPEKNAFEVKFGPGNSDTVTVFPTFSCDIYATGDVSISGSGDVEGIYEALPASDFKSGRFKIREGMDDDVDIISGKGGATAIYRVFNTGSEPLQVKFKPANGPNDGMIGDPIPPGQSFDFETPRNKTIYVATEGDEGIYDFIAET